MICKTFMNKEDAPQNERKIFMNEMKSAMKNRMNCPKDYYKLLQILPMNLLVLPIGFAPFNW